MATRQYTVIFEYDEDDTVWLAHVPALGVMTTHGRTLGEAREMVKEAIEGRIYVLE